jgi:hypothetical protein
MSELRIESYTMPGADLGPENPLPPFRPVRDAQIMAEMPGLPPEMRATVRPRRNGAAALSMVQAHS